MITLVSAKGSPGVTVSALAMTLAAPHTCLLAECDPSGGDVLAGYLQGALPAGPGLARLAVAELRGRLSAEFDAQLVDLDVPHRRRLLLPGVTDPAQSTTVASVWPAIATQLEHWRTAGGDGAARMVVVDGGRVSDARLAQPLLWRADHVLLVVRGTLPSVSAAVPAWRSLSEQLAEHGRAAPGLLVITGGPYPPREIGRRLGAETVVSLPEDNRAATRLSLGGTVHGRLPLLRAAESLFATLSRRTPSEVAGG